MVLTPVFIYFLLFIDLTFGIINFFFLNPLAKLHGLGNSYTMGKTHSNPLMVNMSPCPIIGYRPIYNGKANLRGPHNCLPYNLKSHDIEHLQIVNMLSKRLKGNSLSLVLFLFLSS